eukprot:scaffold11126_cov56-Attheya_sp.AAC.5
MAQQAVLRKTALVLGVGNARSIAWACAQCLVEQNFDVIVTYQNERFQPQVERLVASQQHILKSIPCDVANDASLERLFEQSLPEMLGDKRGLDALVHSVAYAPPDAMKSGSLLGTTREAFDLSHNISAYSLIDITRRALPLLTKSTVEEAENPTSSSVVALSYLGAVRSVRNYNIMGPAKASLESIVRGLSLELAPSIRVNAVSAGPINTLSAKGISGFSDMRTDAQERSPLRRNVTAREVGATVSFLSSPLASGICGQTIYVDGGYSSVAGPPMQ